MTGSAVQLEPPILSVVMVTWNAVEWSRRALAAIVEHTEPVFEVVVVDNASTDATSTWLKNLHGSIVVRNPENLGFGPAANQGVALARGRYVLLLNTDALVHPGWLQPMLGILESEPDVAAVAPKLLHPDGRLQEAAAILWRDGTVLNYGDGDSPHRPEYSFRRDVDYASAACFLVRRSAFTDVGGFDALYAPAYFEDVDLCLSLAARGGRVVYQPLSTVTHARAASSNSRDARRWRNRNLPLFRERWAGVLARRPPSSYYREPSGVIGGRDAPTTERLLVIGKGLPSADGTPADRAAARLVHGVAALWPRIRLTVCALEAPQGGHRAAPLQAAGIEAAWGEKDWPAWLAQRRYHYGGVVFLEAPGASVADAVATTQPQALVIAGDGAAGDGRPGMLLPEPEAGEPAWAAAATTLGAQLGLLSHGAGSSG